MNYISSTTTVAYVDTGQSKTVYLPSTFNIEGKILTVKDRSGFGLTSNITIATLGGDSFENGRSNFIISKNYGYATFIARRGAWFSLTNENDSKQDLGLSVSSLSSIISYGLSTIAAQPHYGVSSLSSIVSYGLSTIATQPHYGVSSLSSIVSYGLSTVAAQPHYGVSSLSSIISYGLSTIAEQPHYGVSSLSSIISYGLSTIAEQPHYSVSSLSSIISYGLSTIAEQPHYGVSSLSSIISYGLSTIAEQPHYGVSSLSSIVSYGLSTVYSPYGVSSLSSIVSYGLSTVYSPYGVSSLSSIVSYGLSTVYSPYGVSSLSSIISYGLSTVAAGAVNPGVSSLSSIISYGLSTIAADAINPGVSSLSSIISYGLSTVAAGAVNPGVSSLSSIISYGLSTIAADAINPGVSSLSSIVSYGLSTVYSPYGISSLSSIISYGLSTVTAGAVNPGVSSLSSILSYGLSTVAAGAINPGVSSLSSIISYGLSTVQVNITQNITNNIVTSNVRVSGETVTSLYNRNVLVDSDKKLKLYIDDQYVSEYLNTTIMYSVHNNNQLIVAVGDGDILYSKDGSNWNRAINPRPSATLWSITYGNGYWAATGSDGGNCLLYSRDGVNWLQNPYSFPYTLNTIAYNSNSNYWVAGGQSTYSASDGNSIFTLHKINDITTKSVTMANSGGLGHRANLVVWGSNMWVATGKSFNNSIYSKVVYSYDGLNWLPASNLTEGTPPFFGSSSDEEGNGLAYGNGVWLVGGTNNLYKSTDGINFTDITNFLSLGIAGGASFPSGNEIYDIKYQSESIFYITVRTIGATGTQYILNTSNNGTSWTKISESNSKQIYRLGVGSGSNPLSNVNNVLINNGDLYTSNIYNSIHINTASLFSYDISVLNTIKTDNLIANNIPLVSYGLSTVYSPYGVSSLSSIISYSLSTVYSPYGVSSLSSIISYGLSTVYSPYGISSLSSIVSYGLSTVYSPYGISSLSSIVSYGLSTVYSPYGVSSLSSIVSYGLSTVYSPYGVSSLSSIVSYGLSTVAAQPHTGVSSLSSIVSYGLSTVAAQPHTGVSSLSSIVSYGLSTVYSPYGVSSLSSIVSYGLSTVYSPYGISSLSSIVSYGLSTVYSPYGVSSLSSIVSYGLSTVAAQPHTGVSSLSSIVSYGLSTVYSPYGVSSLSSIISYGLSSVYSPYGASSLSSIVSYGLSTVYSPYGVSSLSSIVSYGLSTVYSPYGVSSLSSIVSYGLSTVYSPYGISSLSSIVSYGLSTVYSPYGISSLSSIVSYGLSSIVGIDRPGVSSLSSIVSYGLSTVYSPYGVSSLSSIVSYGLSTVYSPYGVSSLSSIVSYGLSTVYAYAKSLSNAEIVDTLRWGLSSLDAKPTPGVSSLSSIVSYGLSTVEAYARSLSNAQLINTLQWGLSSVVGSNLNPINPGVSSLSSIISYGLSTIVVGAINPGVSSLSSIISYGLSTIQVNITQNITNNIVTSNVRVSGETVTSLYNRNVLVDSDKKLKLYINDQYVSEYSNTTTMYSVHNNNQLIVAVGLGDILYSKDGSNWNRAINPRPSATLWSITYGNGYWAATGSDGGNCLLYSRDGINWLQNPYSFPYTLNTVAYNSNSNYWVAGGQNTYSASDGTSRFTLHKINDITTNSVTMANSGGLGHRANLVVWGANIWVATGKSFNNATYPKVVYSYDGLNWLPASNLNTENQTFFGSSPGDEGNGLAYGNGVWLVGGANNLYSSTDGIDFTDITSTVANGINGTNTFPTNSNEIYDIKYQSGSIFYITVRTIGATGIQYILKTSNNGTSWTKISESNSKQIYRLGVGSGSNPLSNVNNVLINNGDLYTSNIYNSIHINTASLFSYDISVLNTIKTDNLIANNIPLVSYGLSTIAAGAVNPGVSSLSSIVSYGLSTVAAGAVNPGVSSLSSIVSYGLSTVAAGGVNPGVSSLSSIVSYGLSTVYSPYGVSSLSSIVSYGLSTVYSPYGVSSLSSIISYGLSSIVGIDRPGVSSLSSIVSYGLSTVYSPYGVSSLSSIVSYGLSTVAAQPHTGVSSLSSIVSYGLSTVYSPYGVSSLSSIVSYGLSTVAAQPHTGVSSLSSIISYGLSTVYSPYGVSSLSSIVSYGLSTVYSPYGISSLSSIISYGLSTVAAQPHTGVSSLSSIVSYGLSTVAAQPHTGVSSLSSIVSYGLSTVYSPYGVSSLSSIVSYGLSTVARQPHTGVSSLSSIVSYSLSTVYSPYGISSLSSIVSYGLSTVAAQPHTGVSSLSSIVSYGLSTVYSPYGISSLSSIVSYGLSTVAAQPHTGVSSLSSIISYGLSTVYSPYGVSSLSSIVSYGLSTVAAQPHTGVSSLSSIVSYGLSTVYSPYGVSSLSSIVSYGLSTVYSPYGVSSLSSIVSYGLSTVARQPHTGVSSLSSIISYGLSTVYSPYGVSSLSSIVSYGFSTVYSPYGVSSLSSIVSYGLSTVAAQPHTGVSSLSSIVSYGLSTVYSPYGVSSLSSIVSYGLSTVYSPYGVSSLSSIVSYGLSTLARQPHTGVSSLSSIVSYGLSTVYSPYGVSSLSSIVSYGLSTVSIIGDATFKPQSIGGIGLSSTNCNIGGPDLITTAFRKTDDWLFNNIVGKPPAPTFVSSNLTKQFIAVSWRNPLLYSIGLLNTYIPHITSLIITLSNNTVPADTIHTSPIVNISAQSNLPMYGTPVQGVQIYNTGSSNGIITLSGINYRQAVNTSINSVNTYNMYISFSNFNVNQNIPMNTLIVPNLQLLAAGVPSAPLSLTINPISSNTMVLTWTAPASNDIGDVNAVANGVNISNYRIVWSNVANATYPRRYTGGRDSNTNTSTCNTSLNYTISGLWPENVYNISISARNQLNTTYGESISQTNIVTSLHPPGSRIIPNNLSNYLPNLNTYTFSYNGTPANLRTNVYSIFNSNSIRTQDGLSFEYNNVGIQTDDSPGISVPGDIMRIIGSNDLNSSVFLSNGGWTDTGNISVSSCNMTISRLNVTDVYSTAANTGFFQKATYRFTISNELLMPRQTAYTFFLTQSNHNKSPITQSNSAIYVDTISGPASIHAVSYNGTPPTPTYYICGIASYINSAVFTNYLDMSNLGTYYLARGPNSEFVSYYISIGSTACGTTTNARGTDSTPAIFNTANTPYTSGILPNPARIETSITLNDNNNTTFTSSSNNLSLTARPVNLCNVGAQTTTILSNSASLKFYVDLPSRFVMLATNTALNSVTNSNGLRVRAVNNAGNIPALNEIASFNNSNSLIDSPYSYELQLVNGFYSTSSYSTEAYRNYTNYYCNTVNYSTRDVNATRYVMLSYSNTTSYTGVQRVKFDFTYAPGGAFPITPNDCNNTFNSNITLEYKFISAVTTTGWLDGNSPLGINGNFNNPPENYRNDTISGLIGTGTNAITRVLQIPSGNYNGIQIYVRIGIPMILPCAFSYLKFMGAS